MLCMLLCTLCYVDGYAFSGNVNLRDFGLRNKLPKSIGLLTELTHLAFDDNEVNGAIPFQIGNCSNLRVFSAGRNKLTGCLPPAFEFLQNLVTIKLGVNLLSGICDLSSIENLQFLSIANNNITPIIINIVFDLGKLNLKLLEPLLLLLEPSNLFNSELTLFNRELVLDIYNIYI